MIFIIGNTKGFGGVQTCHIELKNAYSALGRDVMLVDSLASFISSIGILWRCRKNSLALFSGISIFLAPFYLSCSKCIFFTHGFYLPYLKLGVFGFLKRMIYEKVVSTSLFFYRWVKLVSPSYVSSLVNSYLVHSAPSVVPWGVGDDYLHPKFFDKKIYDLAFMGRVNKEKIDFRLIRRVVDDIHAYSGSVVKLLFIVPYETPYLREVCFCLSSSVCSITIKDSVSDSQAAQLLSSSRFFMNCFSWEAFGLTFAQALCCGCILLAPPEVPFFQLLPLSVRKFCIPLSSVFADDHQLCDSLQVASSPSREDLTLIRKLFSWRRVVKALDHL